MPVQQPRAQQHHPPTTNPQKSPRRNETQKEHNRKKPHIEPQSTTAGTHERHRDTKHTGARHKHQNQVGVGAQAKTKGRETMRARRAGRSLVPGATRAAYRREQKNPMCRRTSTATSGHPWTASTGVRGDSPRISNAHKPASSARTIPPRARRRPPTKSKGARGASPAQAQRDQTNQNTTPPWTNTPSPTLPSTPTPRTSPHNPKKPPSQLFSLHNNTPIRKTPQDTPKEPPQAPRPRHSPAMSHHSPNPQ